MIKIMTVNSQIKVKSYSIKSLTQDQERGAHGRTDYYFFGSGTVGVPRSRGRGRKQKTILCLRDFTLQIENSKGDFRKKEEIGF